MPLNRDTIGKRYQPRPYVVEAELTKKFSLSYNEDSPRFLDDRAEGGLVAPPMFAVVYTGKAIAKVFFDPDVRLDLERVVQGEQDISWYDLVRPGDQLVSQAEITRMEEKETGEILGVLIETVNQRAEKVCRADWTFFVRGRKERNAPRLEPNSARPNETLFCQTMRATEDQSFRYAEVSGDAHPIHMDEAFARASGFEGITVQGMCIMAFASKAVMDGAAGCDPARLRRLAVRISNPVRPGDTLTTFGWVKEQRADMTLLGLESVNQNGRLVVSQAFAEVSP